jgi:hypothetical protein
MHRIPILLICCFLVQIKTKAQFKENIAHYLDEVNIAKVFKADNKIDSAISHYELALQHFNEASGAWYDLGDLYVKQEQYSKAADAYSNCILNGGFSSRDIHSGNYIDSFNSQHLLPFTQRMDSLIGVFYTKKYNWEFALLVLNLEGADYFSRNIADPFTVNITNDTAKLKEANRLIGLADTTYNLPQLLDYLDNHPFPKASSLNGDASVGLWALAHHILQYDKNNPNVARLAKYIEDAVYAGQFDVKGYVTTLDYQHLNCCAKQLYGMGKTRNKEGAFIYYPEVENIKSIDKRRSAWHLLPLYLEKKVNADWYPDAPAGYDPNTQQK